MDRFGTGLAPLQGCSTQNGGGFQSRGPKAIWMSVAWNRTWTSKCITGIAGMVRSTTSSLGTPAGSSAAAGRQRHFDGVSRWRGYQEGLSSHEG